MAQALTDSELLRLADALADGQWHSGEALAAASGITRAALAKRVARLRGWQLDVEARQGLGYRLAQPIERLDAQALQRAAPGMRVEVLALADSTSSRMLEADPALDPQALFAEFQAQGRGRRGRAWASPFGANLYLSIGWSFASWPPQLTALPLAVGVACARIVRAAGLAEAGLKWPNDLLLDGRKLGGILIEHRGEAGGPCRVVVGVGLNVAMSARQAGAIEQPWTSVHAAQAARGLPLTPRPRLAAELLAALHAALQDFARSGFASFAADWAALDLTRDRSVRISSAQQELSGIARGVDEHGALLLEADGAIQRLHSGEVSLRAAP
ncbi:MAG TPA: biotin--[acetyl-CoA-carboxylase] ligase [Solimonas sp.]|nr:biotin--[acetyl-CoA-carboxylase] ligase [Solimonas sp.]